MQVHPEGRGQPTPHRAHVQVQAHTEYGRRLNLFIGDMYDTYTCPLQPCTHLTLKLLTQGHPRSAEVTHIEDFKSAYISLIIGPRGLQCEANL